MSTAILSTALNLRIAIVGVAPLVDQIRHSVGISSGVAGLFTTIPYACMSLFAFSGAGIISRFGYRRLMQGSLATLAGAALLRAVMPGAPLMLIMTIPIGAAIAVIGVALPQVVRHAFHRRSGAMTGMYVSAMNLGATLASLVAVPLSRLLGGWRQALACAALPAGLATALWRPSRVPEIPRPRAQAGQPTRWRTVLILASVFAAQSICFTGVIVWTPALYIQHGWSRTLAGVTPAFISIISLPFALFLPGRSDGGSRRRWLAWFSAIFCAATLALALSPTSLPWLWLALFAAGNGPLFPLSLTLPLDAAHDAEEASTLTMWTLGVGFGVSSFGPLLMGVLHDVTGQFTVGLVILAGFAAMCGIVGQFVVRAPGPEAAQT